MDKMNMVDMPSLQQRLHEYMKMTGIPGDKFKTILQDVTKIKVFIARINPIEALEEVGRTAFSLVKALAEASFELIFCPAKGYILVTNGVAALATTVQTVVGMKSNIPQRLQPKVDEIDGYLEKIKARMKKVEHGIRKLLEEIDKACKNDFVVSLLKMNELEGDIRSLGCELKTCEIELQAAQELLEKLESTVRKRLFELGVFTVAAAFTGGVLSSGAAVVGAAYLGFCLLPAFGNHSRLLKECGQIKCELRKANLQFREKKRTVEESLTEEMALLDTN